MLFSNFKRSGKMNKILDFIKKHPYIIVNSAGMLLFLLCFFAEPVAAFGLKTAFIIGMLFITGIIAILFIVCSIGAFQAVKRDDVLSAVVFSILGGLIGAYIAIITANRNFSGIKYINLVANAYLWIIAWLAASLALFFIVDKYDPNLVRV